MIYFSIFDLYLQCKVYVAFLAAIFSKPLSAFYVELTLENNLVTFVFMSKKYKYRIYSIRDAVNFWER